MEPGTVVGPYELIERLGAGGMGEVWKARHQLLGHYVAVKFLFETFANDPVVQEKFLQEGRHQAQLAVNCTSIVPAENFLKTDDGRAFLVMRLISGESLGDRLDRTLLTAAEILSVSRNILAALLCAHENHTIHRDVKPTNILLDSSGHAYLTDFGIATLRRQTQGRAPTVEEAEAAAALGRSRRVTRHRTFFGVVGTPEYMSPEQFRNLAVDPRTDIYSFGCVLYEMLTGRPPFVEETEEALRNDHLSVNPLPPSSLQQAGGLRISQALDEVALKALAKDPAARYQSCKQLLEAIEKAFATPRREPPKPPVRPDPPPPLPPPPPKPFDWKWAIAPALVAGAIGGTVLLRPVRTEAPPVRSGPAPAPVPQQSGPAIDEFTTFPSSIRAGQQVTLTWVTRNGKQVLIDGLRRDLTSFGSINASPSSTTTYTLRVQSADGRQISKTVYVTVAADNSVMEPVNVPTISPAPTAPATAPITRTRVAPPEIVGFDISPTTVYAGDEVIAVWEVRGADRVHLQPVGEVPATDRRSLSVRSNTTYVLRADNHADTVSSRPISVRVIEKPAPEVRIGMNVLGRGAKPGEVFTTASKLFGGSALSGVIQYVHLVPGSVLTWQWRTDGRNAGHGTQSLSGSGQYEIQYPNAFEAVGSGRQYELDVSLNGQPAGTYRVQVKPEP